MGEVNFEGSYLNDNELIIVGESNDSLSNIAGVQFKKDGNTPVSAIASNGAFFTNKGEIWNTNPSGGESTYQDGNHTVKAWAIDEAGTTGKENPSVCEFCVDTQEPNKVMNVA